MNNYWHTTQMQDCFITFRSLVKSNNGFFKSQAQANMVNDGRLCEIYTKRAIASLVNAGFANDEQVVAKMHKEYLREMYGFLVEKDVHVIELYGSVSFASYGRKSQRPMRIVFSFDIFGIVAQYKIHFSGDGNVVKDRTELIWERDRRLPLPEFIPIEQVKAAREERKIIANAATTYIGEKGKRQFFEGTVKSITYMGSKSYGPVSMDSYRTIIMTDEGNTIVHWNKIGEEGKRIKFKATVKDHCEYNHVKQTVVLRPANIEILN